MGEEDQRMEVAAPVEGSKVEGKEPELPDVEEHSGSLPRKESARLDKAEGKEEPKKEPAGLDRALDDRAGTKAEAAGKAAHAAGDKGLDTKPGVVRDKRAGDKLKRLDMALDDILMDERKGRKGFGKRRDEGKGNRRDEGRRDEGKGWGNRRDRDEGKGRRRDDDKGFSRKGEGKSRREELGRERSEEGKANRESQREERREPSTGHTKTRETKLVSRRDRTERDERQREDRNTRENTREERKKRETDTAEAARKREPRPRSRRDRVQTPRNRREAVETRDASAPTRDRRTEKKVTVEVTNVPSGLDAEDIESAFAVAGEIHSCDKKHGNYVITFANRKGAEGAIAKYDGGSLNGRKIAVEIIDKENQRERSRRRRN